MSDVLTGPVATFLDAEHVGVLATQRPDGSIRQSVVYFVRDGDRIYVSTELKRAKARDVRRRPYASLCVEGHERPFPSVTVEGPAAILTTGIGELTARIIAAISGKPPERVLTDEQLADIDRVVIELTAARAYGASYLEPRA